MNGALKCLLWRVAIRSRLRAVLDGLVLQSEMAWVIYLWILCEIRDEYLSTVLIASTQHARSKHTARTLHTFRLIPAYMQTAHTHLVLYAQQELIVTREIRHI